MSEQLYVLISNRPYEGGWTKYREATPEQIDEAAGVTELRKRLGQYQTLIDTQQGVIVEQRERCETTRELESAVVDLTCTISDLKVQLAQRDEDAAVGKAIREWLDANHNLSICISPMVSTDGIDYSMYVIRGYVIYTCQAKDPIHSDWVKHGIGKDIPDALRSAGLLPVREAAHEH